MMNLILTCPYNADITQCLLSSVHLKVNDACTTICFEVTDTQMRRYKYLICIYNTPSAYQIS